jgi:hypothetical protein
MRPLRVCPLLIVCALARLGHGQSPPTPLPAGAAAQPDANIGRAVAASAGRVAVGVPEYDLPSPANISGAGAVAIYEPGAGGWTQRALVSASDAYTADVFGAAVALDGDLLVVGAMNVGLLTPALWTGAAYVFERVEGVWVQTAKLLPPEPQEFHEFGQAVACDAESMTVVVGARLDSTAGPGAGSVVVYRKAGSQWTATQELFADTPNEFEPNDSFGYSVALDGSTLVVGTPYTDVDAQSTGSAWVFERGDAGFALVARLAAGDASYRDLFGASVSVSGTMVAVGAPGVDGAGGTAPDIGAAYIFEKTPKGWVEAAKLLGDEPRPLARVGSSLALAAPRLLVGAPGFQSGGLATGAAHFFEQITGTWEARSTVVAADAAAGDQFGASVALWQTTAVVGAPFHDSLANNAGAAYRVEFGAPAPCPADLDGDRRIDGADLTALLLAWGSGSKGDIDGDGAADAADLAALLIAWGECP